MVECNAHAMGSFFTTLKNVSAAGYKSGKEWAIWLFHSAVDLVKRLRETLVSQFKAYFIRKDLSKDELQHQIKVITIVTRVVMFFVSINVIRISYRMLKMMMKKKAKLL